MRDAEFYKFTQLGKTLDLSDPPLTSWPPPGSLSYASLPLDPFPAVWNRKTPQNTPGILEWVFPLSPHHPTPLPTAVAVGAAPVALSAMGFTGTGIAAASIAAKLMSAAAIANGGGVAAGSMVAAMQSAGVVGLSTSTNIILGAVGAAAGALI